MTSRKFGRSPHIQQSLSSLSSQINLWSSSTFTSPSDAKTSSQVAKIRRGPAGVQQTEELDFEQWYQRFSPQSISDVAIHKRKLQDVSKALVSMLEENDDETRILLLTGRSGTSKSTLIKQLANHYIPKYRKGRSSGLLGLSDDDLNGSNNSITEYNGSESMEDFLGHARYRTGPNLSLILIEYMPNVFHGGTRLAFQQLLLEWIYNAEEHLPPLVICLTECELEHESAPYEKFGIDYSFTAESVLGSTLLTHRKLKRIKFNPINATLMKKILTKVSMHRKQYLISKDKWRQKDTFIDRVSQKTGDIRSGIAALEFWAKSSCDLPMMLEEPSISYFHSIGRVLYGSRDYENDNEMVNSMMNSFNHHYTNQNFKLGILENYGSYNKGQFNLKSASLITDALSRSDTFDRVSESVEYAVRSVRNILEQVGQSKNINGKSLFPREGKIKQLVNEFKVKCDDYVNVSLYKYDQLRTTRDVTAEFGFYEPLIRSTQLYKKRALDHYLATVDDVKEAGRLRETNSTNMDTDMSLDILGRIGGDIKSLGSENSITADAKEPFTAKDSLLQLKQKKEDKQLRLIALRDSREACMNSLNDHDEEHFIEDPIIDSDMELPITTTSLLEDDDDSFYDRLLEKRTTKKGDLLDESLSDSDLELL